MAKNGWRVKCKHCGKTDMEWRYIDAKWRLYETDPSNSTHRSPHICPKFAGGDHSRGVAADNWWQKE